MDDNRSNPQAEYLPADPDLARILAIEAAKTRRAEIRSSRRIRPTEEGGGGEPVPPLPDVTTSAGRVAAYEAIYGLLWRRAFSGKMDPAAVVSFMTQARLAAGVGRERPTPKVEPVRFRGFAGTPPVPGTTGTPTPG